MISPAWKRHSGRVSIRAGADTPPARNARKRAVINPEQVLMACARRETASFSARGDLPFRSPNCKRRRKKASPMSNDLYHVKEGEYFETIRMPQVKALGGDLGRVLDVGGGNGATSQFLVDNNLATSAVVVDPYMTVQSTEKVTMEPVEADDALFERLKEKGERFDTAIFLDVLEHLMNPWAVLKGTREVVKPGGKVFVSLPNAQFVGLIVPLVLFGRFDYKKQGVMDLTHIRWFTRATAVEMVEQAGFTVEKVDREINLRLATLNKLTLGIFSRFFAQQHFIHARLKE